MVSYNLEVLGSDGIIVVLEFSEALLVVLDQLVDVEVLSFFDFVDLHLRLQVQLFPQSAQPLLLDLAKLVQLLSEVPLE